MYAHCGWKKKKPPQWKKEALAGKEMSILLVGTSLYAMNKPQSINHFAGYKRNCSKPVRRLLIMNALTSWAHWGTRNGRCSLLGITFCLWRTSQQLLNPALSWVCLERKYWRDGHTNGRRSIQPCHHSSNGAVEHWNRVLKECIIISGIAHSVD